MNVPLDMLAHLVSLAFLVTIELVELSLVEFVNLVNVMAMQQTVTSMVLVMAVSTILQVPTVTSAFQDSMETQLQEHLRTVSSVLAL